MIEVNADFVWTVAQLRRYAEENTHACTWVVGAEIISKEQGSCRAITADGKLVVFKTDDLGKMTRKTYQPWQWRMIDES